MFLPDCWLQLHDNKLLVSKATTVLEKERPNMSVDTSNMSLLVFFTSGFDNRRAGLWLQKLTDWIVQRQSDVSALQIAALDAYCQSLYYATYFAIWFGNSDAKNCTLGKLRHTQQTSCFEKQIHCDDQTLRFEIKFENKNDKLQIITMKPLRTLKIYATHVEKRYSSIKARR